MGMSSPLTWVMGYFTREFTLAVASVQGSAHHCQTPATKTLYADPNAVQGTTQDPPGAGPLSPFGAHSPSLCFWWDRPAPRSPWQLQQQAASCSPRYQARDPFIALQTSLRSVGWTPASMPGIEGKPKVSGPDEHTRCPPRVIISKPTRSCCCKSSCISRRV